MLTKNEKFEYKTNKQTNWIYITNITHYCGFESLKNFHIYKKNVLKEWIALNKIRRRSRIRNIGIKMWKIERTRDEEMEREKEIMKHNLK